MQSSFIWRNLIRFPLTIIVAVNLVGLFYVENLYDFNTFVRAGQAIVSGENPYSLPERLSTNLNPPVTLLFFQFLAELDPDTIYHIWRIISFIFYIVLVAVLAYVYNNPGTPTRVVLAFCMTGIWYTLLMGQMYVFLLLLCICAWLFLKSGKQLAAGLLIGLLAAIKPNFLVWPGLLLIIGAWPTAAIAFGMVIFLSILPLVSYGAVVYVQWFEMLAIYKAAPLATNMSIYGLTSRLGLPNLGLILAFVLLVFTAYMVWRKRPNVLEVSSLAIVVALLATQYAWVGYAVLLLPIYFSRDWSWQLVASVALLCVPSIIVFYIGRQSDLAQIAAGLIYFIALALLFVELARSFVSTSNSSHPQEELQPLAK